jgi:iron complex transport system substrate-binding protein
MVGAVSAAGRGWRAILMGALAAVLAVAPVSPAAAGPHPRVVSINMCTDQLVLALADPDQILGLSAYARDPLLSFAAAEAANYPSLSGGAEEVLVLQPDLVLAGRYTRTVTRGFLKAKGIALAEFDVARSIAEATAQIRRAGELLGQEARAEAAIAAIDAAVARAKVTRAKLTPAEAAPRRRLSVLPLQRRGWVAGGRTLTTDLLETLGLANAGAAFAATGGFVPLERIVVQRPDALLLTREAVEAEDQGSALLAHPALADLYPPERRIYLPERLTVCGGPMLAEAIDRLAAEAERLGR